MSAGTTNPCLRLNTTLKKRKEELFRLLKDSVFARLKFMPGISSLAATLLVVATFNDALLPLNAFVRALLTLLLLLIPIPLFLYLYESNEAGIRATRELEKELNKELSRPKKNLILWAGIYFPWFALLVISFVIFSTI